MKSEKQSENECESGKKMKNYKLKMKIKENRG
jgi:hypothetical protein